MEPRGGTSGVKQVDVDPEQVELHDTDNSELSVSTTSVSMLPHLEATDAERVLNEEEKKKRREARKLKREAREKKKKEQQRLEEKKARKEERKLKREKEERQERRKHKKQKPLMHLQVSYLAAPKMVMMMMSLTKCIARRTRKERVGRITTTNMPPYPLTILLCL
jgi:cation transport ATPase